MGTLKYILPVIINIALTFLFDFLMGNFLIYEMRPDFYYDLDTGIKSYTFGEGSFAVSFILWLFLATTIFIIRIGKKDFTLGKRIIYYVCSIGMIGAVDLYWWNLYSLVFYLW